MAQDERERKTDKNYSPTQGGLPDVCRQRKPTRPYMGRFLGTSPREAPWEADGNEIIGNVSPSAPQADLAKKPIRGRSRMAGVSRMTGREG